MLTDPKLLPAELPLPPSLRRGEQQAHYILDDKPRLALRLAWAARRPLLVVGEPGSGKTQLAAALATQWQVPLLAHTVNGQSKPEDLLYHFDAVARLADAQIYAALRDRAASAEAPPPSGDALPDPLDPHHYLRPGPLWWAWNWGEASKLVTAQARRGRSLSTAPPAPEAWQPAHGSVVLIDEIDKAGIELPEGLLDVLDTGGFDVPLTGKRLEPSTGGDGPNQAPLVIITSNGARDLPAPFLRRCVALDMGFGPDLIADFTRRARAHFSPAQCGDVAIECAAKLIAADRELARGAERYVPGVAEFLDLLAAVAEVAPGAGDDEQKRLIDQFAPAVTTEKGKAAYQ